MPFSSPSLADSSVHPLSRLKPLAKAIALLMVAGGAQAAGQPFGGAWFAAKGAAQGGGGGRTGAQLPSMTPPPLAQQQKANQQLQRSLQNLNNTVAAIAAQQALQAAGRNTPVGGTVVPDGLGAGGLQVDSSMPFDQAWQNAKGPVETRNDGKVQVTVEQTADKAILNWESFNVGRDTTLKFQQQSDWAVLNRVNDPQARPSQILGRIEAGGTVMVLNSNGVIFDGTSQVNTRNLVVAAASMSDSQFRDNGLYANNNSQPSFTDAAGAVRVERGAQITTRDPATSTAGGGYVLLLGNEVENAGSIATNRGQTLLAAGDNFIIRRGVGSDGNVTSTTRGNEVQAQQVAGGSGTVRNSGIIQAASGDITLAGRTVQQDGVLLSSTSVDTRGTLHLKASEAVTLGEGSTSAILLDSSGSTALDSQRDAALIPASGATGAITLADLDRREQSRIEINSSGTVDFRGGSVTLATGGQVVVNAGQRTLVRDGANIDVSGAVGVKVAMEANNIKVNVQGNEQRDAAVNREGGALNSQDVWVDVRDLVRVTAGTNGYATDRWYTAGGLLEVAGYLGTQGHSVGEWMAQGGSVRFTGNDLVTQQGSQINLSGGTLDVQEGYIKQTWLKGSDGRLYELSSAPGDLLYDGIYRGYETYSERWNQTRTFYNPLIGAAQRYENGYTVGRDAGSLVVGTGNAVLQGDIVGTVFQGDSQTQAAQAGLDGYNQSQKAVARGAQLIVGEYTPYYVKSSGLLQYALGASAQTVQRVDIAAGIGVDAGTIGLDDSVDATRQGTLSLDSDLLNSFGLGGLKISALESVEVNDALQLADGGELGLFAKTVDINADLTVRAGVIEAGNVRQQVNLTSAAIDVYLNSLDQQGSLRVADGVHLDASGRWSNLLLDADAGTLAAWRDGGRISLRNGGDVVLGDGTLLDVSSGASIGADGKRHGGKGGDITLHASASTALGATGALQLGGELRGLGVGGAGTLSLRSGRVNIGGSATDEADDTLYLAPEMFSLGFAHYEVKGQAGLEVAEGAQVQVTRPVWRWTENASAVSGAAAIDQVLEVWTPPLYQEDPLAGVLTQRAGASLALQAGGDLAGLVDAANQSLVIGQGSLLQVDPGQSIRVRSPGQVTVLGMLLAHGGSIDIRQQQFGDIDPSENEALGDNQANGRSIWIGEQALLDVSGQANWALDSQGRRYGRVDAGGSIVIGGTVDTQLATATAADAFVVLRPGSRLEASGASTWLDIRGVGSREIASNGGSIALASHRGLLLDGDLHAASGGATAAGGSLQIALETPAYANTTTNAAVLSVRRLVLGQSAAGEDALVDARPGETNTGLVYGQARVSADEIQAGGFSDLTLLSHGVLALESGTRLATSQALRLYGSAFEAVASSSEAQPVELLAPYVLLSGTGQYFAGASRLNPLPAAPQPSALTPSGTLTVHASQLLDVAGSVYLGAQAQILNNTTFASTLQLAGFADTELHSDGELRFLAPYGNAARTQLWVPGDLDLLATQIYPGTGAIASVMAGYRRMEGQPRIDPESVLRIGRVGDATPAMPYSAFGQLELGAGSIEQGGILRAPLGAISFSSITSNGLREVHLLPGSLTSVSGAGLVMPYGGTTDGINYSFAGNKVTLQGAGGANSTGTALEIGVTFATSQVDIQSGAVVDLSGGGELTGAGFISGRGGSTDARYNPLVQIDAQGRFLLPGLADNPVYAIVPGVQAVSAPVGGEAGAVQPLIGQQITIGAGVPGLPAGTYTLLPSTYALLPGAFRVELNGLAGQGANLSSQALRNGSWSTSGYLSVAGTTIRDALPSQVILSSADVLRRYSQYNETSYADFVLADAIRQGIPRAMLPADARSLLLRGISGSSLSVAGTVDFTPAKDGYGGSLLVLGDTEVLADGASATDAFSGSSLYASDLNRFGASRMVLGAIPTVIYGQQGSEVVLLGDGNSDIVLREGSVLSGPDVMLVGNITLEQGARIDTLGKGDAAFDSSDGFSYRVGTGALLAVSNGGLNLQAPGTQSNGTINLGACSELVCGESQLYSEGTIGIVSNGSVSIGDEVRYGTRNLNLAVSAVNVGEVDALQAAATNHVLPAGLSLNQSVLTRLLQGDTSHGAPALENLILTARDSINFFGTVSLDTLDPATGRSSLANLVLGSPAIQGYGDANDVASIRTASLIWSGATQAPAAAIQGGPGTGSGRLLIQADTIELGYAANTQPSSQTDEARLALGFSSVELNAGKQITANHRGSLAVYQSQGEYVSGKGFAYSGGELVMRTPLLTGTAGSVTRLSVGGDLRLEAPVGGAPAAARKGTEALGAEWSMSASNLLVDTRVELPSGKLSLTASGDLRLGAASSIDLAGRTATFNDVEKYSWGGDLLLRSDNGDIRQDSGSTIDLSARNNQGGSLGAIALGEGAGTVSLLGAILGSTSGVYQAAGSLVPYAGAEVEVRARHLGDGDLSGDFAALNQRLNDGQVFGARRFQLKEGDLTIGDGLKASNIELSLDGGALTVSGLVDASGEQVGSIRLAARDGLTLGSQSVLDAHGSLLRVDSYGKIIDSPNRAIVELSSGNLVLADGARIDLRHGTASGRNDLVALGTLDLKAPRIGGATAGDIAIDASGRYDIQGAASISVYGMQRYTDAPLGSDPATSGKPYQVIDQTYLDGKHADSTAFITAALANTALLQDKLGGLNNERYLDALHLRPGVEIASTTADGDLVVQGDIDLSGYRYASLNPHTQRDPSVYGSGEVGGLVLRAGGDLTLYGSINDGFAPPATSPDDNGWLLVSGVQPFAADLVVPGPGVTLADGTVFQGGVTLNYELPIKGATLAAGTRLAVETRLTAPYTLAAGSVLAADIRDAGGTVLFAAGSLLEQAVTLPSGTRLGAGTLLVNNASVGAMRWPAGVPLPSIARNDANLPNTLVLDGDLALARGALIPSQTDVKLPEGTTFVNLRSGGGRNWAVASMLPAGSQSWSLRMVAGSDLDAADSRITRADGQGTLRLADTHYAANIVTGSAGKVLTEAAIEMGYEPWAPVDDSNSWLCDIDAIYCTDQPQWTWSPDNWAGYPAGSPIAADDMWYCDSDPANCIEHVVSSTATAQRQLYSVLRTGTGDLDLAAAGSLLQNSPYGVYTAGTQAQDVTAAYQQARGQRGGSLLGSGGSEYESLTLAQYQAWFPEHGGNLDIRVGGDLTGDQWVDSNGTTGNAQYGSAQVGNWLWRQGNGGATQDDQPAAWWINFGTYVADPLGGTPYLVGFSGYGTLGGGDVNLRVAGVAGNQQARGGKQGNVVDDNLRSQGVVVAVGGSGRAGADGELRLTGGGDMDIRIGGAVNPDLAARTIDTTGNSRLDLQGVLANLRGSTSLLAGSIGGIDLRYGLTRPRQDSTETRAYDLNRSSMAAATGGLVLVPGDAGMRLATRGDLVVGGAGDPGRITVPNTLAFTGTDGRQYEGGGSTWFSLWTANTAIDLFSAGGNLTPSTQIADVLPGNNSSVMTNANSSMTDGRFVYPSILRAVAAQGSLYLGTSATGDPATFSSLTPYSLLLAPSVTGDLQLLAADSIYAGGYSVQRSGTDPQSLTSIWNPGFAGYAGFNNVTPVVRNGNVGGRGVGLGSNPLFYFGADTAGILPGELEPSRFYALNGDIVGLSSGEVIQFSTTSVYAGNLAGQTWYEGAGAVRMIAGRDIVASGSQLATSRSLPAAVGNLLASTDSRSIGNLFIHYDANDISLVQAGRDILYSSFNVAGPGTLEISAGRNVLMEDRAAINSLGAILPGDSRPGASVVLQAGAAGVDYSAFLARYLDPLNLAVSGTPLADQPGKVVRLYDEDLVTWLGERFGFEGDAEAARAYLAGLPAEQQRIFARQVYFEELKAGGREYNDASGPRLGSYLRGRNAIAALFPSRDVAGNPISYDGDIVLFGGAGIHTNFGGDIQLLSPGGQQVFGVEGAAPPSTAGVVTQGVGNIQSYSQGSILLGQSRIMTTFGGSIQAWSAEGDINAGRGTKTTLVYTPPKRVYDAWGNVTLSPQVPSTGAGIATLNPIAEVAPGDIDLIAPQGTIDAGEAGIRVSGNVNIAALQVVNAANIQTQGQSTGLPVAAVVNTNAMASASAAANSATQAAEQVGRQQQDAARQRAPSIFSVRVLGFGDERLPGGEAGANRAPLDDRQSSVQVLGTGALDEQARARLTEGERSNLVL
ncbi:MAG: filamentous hemagglutinin family protein [Paucimonas sp.]|jgi:filamentous hemagglutinin family protein|nr:filamentous hemagglutinin family protein [Paucimonas sp.]